MPKRLSDPLNDRQVSELLPPFVEAPDDSKVFPLEEGHRPDWQYMMELFRGEGFLSKSQAMQILTAALDLLKRESNHVRVNYPATIIGDIHGQLFDLIPMLSKCKHGKVNLVFLGDYVDRGRYSIEVTLLLLALKVNYPVNVTMLRGNHESR